MSQNKISRPRVFLVKDKVMSLVSELHWYGNGQSRFKAIHPITGKVVYKFLSENYILMRPTGMTDKNGKEIFEGDIVSLYGEAMSEVFFSDAAFCVDFLSGGTPLHAFGQNQLKVLGNIHEDLTLVEEMKNRERKNIYGEKLPIDFQNSKK